MSEENLNANNDPIRVIVELDEGAVTNVHANRPGVEVIVLETVTAESDVDQSERTAVEHNGTVIEYVATTYTPDHAAYNTEWEASVIAGIQNRVGAEA